MFKKLKEKTIDSTGAETPLPGLAIRAVTPIEDPQEEKVEEERIEEQPLLLNESLQDNNNTSLKKDSKAESVLHQLTSELVILRRQYNQLITDKQQIETESREKINTLQTSLTEKEEMVIKMERRITELTWSVDSLTSRLQMYSNYEKEDIIKKLQTQVEELEARLHQRDLDIEIYETRVAAQSKQRHEEQMSHKKRTHGLEDTMSSLQASVIEKDQRLNQLNSEVLKIRMSLGEVEKKRQELEEMIDQQKIHLNERDQQLEDQVCSHSEEMERVREQHRLEIDELQEQIKQIKNELKDKEDKLQRLVIQLPDEPVVNTVLEGYSKTKMANTFEVTLCTPGGVYRKEVEPLARPDPNAPPILPLEETTPTNYTDRDQFNPQYEVQLLECKRYNEMLEEELEEKNKTIKLQQQKLTDMKKALVNNKKEVAPPPPPPSLLALPITNEMPSTDEKRFVISSDINFQYLKNVIIRFICTREDEALQLVKAVSTLLELNKAEEKYIRDYLLYKLSWFGSMPVPPSESSIIK